MKEFENILNKIFPKFKCELIHEYGYIRCEITYNKDFHRVVYADIIGKKDNEILLQIINQITSYIMEYYINLEEVSKLNKEVK